MTSTNLQSPRKGKSTASKSKSVRIPSQEGSSVAVRLLNEGDGAGPVLASICAADALGNSNFSLYSQEVSLRNGESLTKAPHFVRGSLDTIEYISSNNDLEPDPGHASQFLVGVYDRRLKTVTFRRTTAHSLDRFTSGSHAPPSLDANALDYQATRAALGQAFGNAKAKRGITAAAKRTIDPRAVSTTINALRDRIEAGTEPAAETQLSSSSTLPVNHSATSVDEIYPLDVMVTSAELSSLDVENVRDICPTGRDGWLACMASKIAPDASIGERQRLAYIACLIRLFHRMRRSTARRSIEEQNPLIPGIVLDGFYDRFTELIRGSQQAIMTSGHQAKLISYILALCLRMENWCVEFDCIREDLCIEESRLRAHFQAIGCKVTRRPANRSSNSDGHPELEQGVKVAILDFPPTFPALQSRKRRK